MKFYGCRIVIIFIVIDFPDQYKTIHCESTNKSRAYNKLYHTYHNSLENLNKFIHKFPKTFYSVNTLSISLFNFKIFYAPVFSTCKLKIFYILYTCFHSFKLSKNWVKNQIWCLRRAKELSDIIIFLNIWRSCFRNANNSI